MSSFYVGDAIIFTSWVKRMHLERGKELGVVAYSHNLCAWEAQQEDHGFEASLSYKV